MFGKCSETFFWPSEQFWKIFGNLWKVVGNLRKIVKNCVFTWMCQFWIQTSSKWWGKRIWSWSCRLRTAKLLCRWWLEVAQYNLRHYKPNPEQSSHVRQGWIARDKFLYEAPYPRSIDLDKDTWEQVLKILPSLYRLSNRAITLESSLLVSGGIWDQILRILPNFHPYSSKE